MARKKNQLEIVARHGQTAAARPFPPTVSGRWILIALGGVIVAAAMCAWGALCLLFWQGAWQLLYRPTSSVAHTPAEAGLSYEPVSFAATETGTPRLRGWWIPVGEDSASARYTVLYLHGRIGNLGDCLNVLARIHASGVNIFAFDYRGYGQSEFVHPSERHWRQDADWALYYLTATRRIPVGSIVLVGSGLGANLALGVASAHPELAGVVLDEPLNAPVNLVLSDARAHLVPAHLLFHDRYRMRVPAMGLRIPSLWIFPIDSQANHESDQKLMAAYAAVISPKSLVGTAGNDLTAALKSWLAQLHAR